MHIIGVLLGAAVVAAIVWSRCGALFTRKYPRDRRRP
jgi:hypothetical protein